MLHRLHNSNCKFWRISPVFPLEKRRKKSYPGQKSSSCCIYDSHEHKYTLHTPTRADHRQGCGLVSDKALQDQKDVLHSTCTSFVAGPECCSQGRKDRLCGWRTKHRSQTCVSIFGGAAITQSTTQTWEPRAKPCTGTHPLMQSHIWTSLAQLPQQHWEADLVTLI